MSHYYTSKPDVESKPQSFTFNLMGKDFTFTTDAGVFSKKEVDFGSRVLIDTFEEPEIEGAIIDVGCGYGPIGLSLASSMPSRTIHMVDVNQRAILLSKQNAELNGISNVRIYESDRLAEIIAPSVAAIVTNPPIRAGKDIVHSIYEQSYDRLIENGELWVVIQKKQGAPSTVEKLESLFKEVEVVEKVKGYWIVKAIK
ncbi:class I SAM-dependent methyltransferase [Mangrovibacillus cuniculi]|uniref:Class I SAM-dependent methyltransferase n=1 Tax=Mangrovibacillus cuniculi TaxID=2593652 RepID=A0A7S8CDL0_9BACI|nr:methyltransferase [Mangrovibacillus cuniculi]QPC48025.1 class I SAM-dependent methyltransferase [Mangrovibacillus cuniculi]